MIGGPWSPWNITARHETRGVTTSAATTGTVLTADAAADTYGAWVDIGAATTFDYRQIFVSFVNNSLGADYTVNIGINVGGNEFVIAEHIRFASARRLINEGNQYYQLPIFVKAGAQLAAQCACSGTLSRTMEIAITGSSAGLGGMPGFSRCRALYTPSASHGLVIDPGVTANTKSAWAELVASSGFDAAALLLMVGINADVTRGVLATTAIDIGFGAGSAEAVMIADILTRYGTGFDAPVIGVGSWLFPGFIAAGTRLVARAQCTDNTASDRTFDLAAWGFEP